MRKNKIRIIACGLLIAMSLSSCGKKQLEVPELLEPKVTNESYRPVERGDVGEIWIGSGESLFTAKVVPAQESYFWTTSAKIKNIEVKVGDYVEAGQVLATADQEDANEVLQGYNADLATVNAVFAQNQEIYQAQHEELEYKIKGAKELGNSASDLEKELEILEENNRYDVKLHNFNVSSIGKRIAEVSKLLSQSSLVATKAGYVTYVKSTKDTNAVSVSDAVVVVADTTDMYVEADVLTENPSDRRKLPKYTSIYTIIDGVHYELEEYPYTDEELAVAENKSAYPKLRYKFVDESKMPELGGNILINMAVDVHEDVLRIGIDSLEKDNQGYFVYVLTDGKKEARRVEIGKRDEYYAEVISGLEEGEFIYFTSLSASPEEYEPHEVSIEDYVIKNEVRNKKKITTESKVFYAEVEGVVNEIMAGEGATVAEGDLVCTIKTSSGGARLTEMATAMSELKSGYEEQIKDLDNAIAELQLQIDGMDAATLAEDAMPQIATGSDAFGGNEKVDPYLRQELALQITQIRCRKQIATVEYQHQLANMQKAYAEASKNNNGNGIISVYAEHDGVVSDLRIHEGKNIKVGDRLFDLKMPIEGRIVANTFLNRTLGQEITLYDEDTKKEYTATIMGGPGCTPEIFTKMVDGHIYITSTTPDPSGSQYYVKLEDDSIADQVASMDADYTFCRLKDAVIIGRNDVHVETVQETDHYYVWKIVDGILVKQYVSLFKLPSLDSEIVCVTSGLKRGDVLAGQKGIEEDD